MSEYMITYSANTQDAGAFIQVTTFTDLDVLSEASIRKFIADVAEANAFVRQSIVIEFIVKLDEKIADVRMTAGELRESKRVAQADAIRHFGEFEAEERGNMKIYTDANDFADRILSGEIVLSGETRP